MKKILLAIDSLNINIDTLDFACYIARLTNSKLTGIFLENQVLEQRPIRKQLHRIPYTDSIMVSDLPDHELKKKRTTDNIEFFRNACENRSVRCNIHRDRGIPAKEIIEESRFADLMILDPEMSFAKNHESIPTGFVRQVLKEAECPVIISPESFESIDQIVFTYDASKSAVFAIKHFAWLFPEFSNKKVTLLEVDRSGEEVIDEKYKINEWLKTHYSDIDFKILKGYADDELLNYLLWKKNIFVVMGAYSRNTVSTFFKKSDADLVLSSTNLPIFIAHNK